MSLQLNILHEGILSLSDKDHPKFVGFPKKIEEVVEAWAKTLTLYFETAGKNPPSSDEIRQYLAEAINNNINSTNFLAQALESYVAFWVARLDESYTFRGSDLTASIVNIAVRGSKGGSAKEQAKAISDTIHTWVQSYITDSGESLN